MDLNAQMAGVDGGRSFWNGSTGRWAGEQLIMAIKHGRPLTAAALRTCDLLRPDDWRLIDTAITTEVGMRLQGVADLVARGLTRPLTNAMGKTVFQYWTSGDLDPAIVSMDGMSRAENDRIDMTSANVPIPITHKDFFFNLRQLSVSRGAGGESLDTTHVRTAGRKVAEMVEYMLFQGGKIFGGLPIYGYTTHPNRNTGAFGTGGNWAQAAKTGEQVLTDVFTMMQALINDRFYGPYFVYTGPDAQLKLNADFKSATSGTTRSRLVEIEQIAGIRTVDQMPSGAVVMVQMTSDVVELLDGEPFQSVQWDVGGGFGVNFKAFAIQVPVVKNAVESTRSGIYHMS